MPHPVHVIPVRQFVKDGKLYKLTVARTYHRCANCGHLIDAGTNYYSVSWLHSGLGRVNVPDSFHIDCVGVTGG